MSVEDGGQGFSGEGSQGQEFDSGTGTPSGINPAWNEMLQSIPQEHHSQVIPHLQRWDKGVQDRFNQVHSQYEGYKPFVEQQISPDDLNFAMGLLNAVNSDPHAVKQALDSWIEQEGIENPNAQQEPSQYGEQGQQNGQFDLTSHPEYQQLQQVVEEMAGILVNQREQEQQAQEDQALDDELNSLKQQHGDFDEPFVLSRMAAGASGEDAVQEYQQFVQQVLSGQRRPGPKILGAGGSLPQNNIDVKKLDDKERRGLVENMLRQASQQE
jgi:hypothetical protein